MPEQLLVGIVEHFDQHFELADIGRRADAQFTNFSPPIAQQFLDRQADRLVAGQLVLDRFGRSEFEAPGRFAPCPFGQFLCRRGELPARRRPHAAALSTRSALPASSQVTAPLVTNKSATKGPAATSRIFTGNPQPPDVDRQRRLTVDKRQQGLMVAHANADRIVRLAGGKQAPAGRNRGRSRGRRPRPNRAIQTGTHRPVGS